MGHTHQNTEHNLHHHEAHDSEAHGPHRHEHSHERLPLSKWWKRTVLLGNAAIGAAEMALGFGSSAMSVMADGIHNIGDVATYREQIENAAGSKRTEQRRQRSRLLSHWTLSTLSGGVGAKAAHDLATGHESTWATPNMLIAGASLTLSGTLYAHLKKQMKATPNDSPYAKDLAKHFWGLDIPSAGLALMGAAVQRYSVPVEQVLAVANGALGAWIFRPTKANLTHACPVQSLGGGQHGHAHGLVDALQQHVPERQRPRKRAVALGMAALAGVMVGAAGGASNITNEHPTTPPATAHVPPAPTSPDLAPYECITAHPGDSQWALARRQLHNVGMPADEPLVHRVAMATAAQNYATHPNPHRIYPGDCLSVPSYAQLQTLALG